MTDSNSITISNQEWSYTLKLLDNRCFICDICIEKDLRISTKDRLVSIRPDIIKSYQICVRYSAALPESFNNTFLKYDVFQADSGDFLLFQMGENPTCPPPLDMELEPGMCLIRDSEGKSEMIRAEFMAESTMVLLYMLPGDCYQFHVAWTWRKSNHLPESKSIFFNKYSDNPVGYWVQIHF